MTKRDKYATVYVNQASRLSFLWLQKTATAEDTLQGKEAFEQYSKDHGVTIWAYHTGNGIFKAYQWVEACQQNGQGLIFAGVNAHHQNGIAERKIRSLQELARTMLLHANKRWPQAISTNLWPYAIHMANNVMNKTTHMQDPKKGLDNKYFKKLQFKQIQNTGSHSVVQSMSWIKDYRLDQFSTNGNREWMLGSISEDHRNMQELLR